MDKRTICLLNDSFPPEIDGVANAVVNYAKNITKSGENAIVVTPTMHCPITSCLLARSLRAMVDAPLVLTYHTKYDVDIAKAVRGKLLQESAIRALVQNIASCDEVWVVSRGAGV